jgi:hypothetical protein
MTPLPADLGSIDDYENQGEDSPASSRVGGPANVRFGPNENRANLVNDVILGALVIGLFAMEANAAHQQRHR